jgi:tetratricopeptide (TPR) repeat protein/predicted Ser/Thr protein kinase
MKFAHFEFDPKTAKLGEGPSSEVYRAIDTRLGRTVALKILRPHVEFDPNAKSRFEREAKHTSNLTHQNIATVFEYGQDRGTSYIAMEFLEGRTLDKLLKDHRLDYEEGLHIALQVASALKLVHERGLIHRDLKPANIMVMDGGHVKLLDFGICRSTGESSITQEGMLVGTVLYMSPEQVLGEELDLRSDVFSLGSVFFHAFTGELPFPGKSFPDVCMSILEAVPAPPSHLRPDFPAPLGEFLHRCHQREPEERYGDGAEIHGALLAISDNLRLSSSAERPSNLRGKLIIPPFELEKDAPGEKPARASEFSAGLRADLRKALGRLTRLDIAIPNELPEDLRDVYVMRGKLIYDGEAAELDYGLERARTNGPSETTRIYRGRVQHSDENEWGLQAKLVGSLARSIKRKLAEYTLVPHPEEGRDPDQAVKLAHRAHRLLHRATAKHLVAAVSIYRGALKLDPSCVLAHAGMAEALVRKFLYWDGDTSFLQEARESAHRALAIDPFAAMAHTALGFAHMMNGDIEEAQREYRLAIQIDHDEWLAHRLLGALLARIGALENAVPLLERAIALRPAHIGSYDHLYGALCRLERYEAAIEIADRGVLAADEHLQKVREDQEARMHKALLLARMGLSDKARETVEEARKLFPKDAYTAYKGGCVLTLVGDLDDALGLLREAQERGFHLQPEIQRNSDLEILRGRKEFQALLT